MNKESSTIDHKFEEIFCFVDKFFLDGLYETITFLQYNLGKKPYMYEKAIFFIKQNQFEIIQEIITAEWIYHS